jgi:ferredoxin
MAGFRRRRRLQRKIAVLPRPSAPARLKTRKRIRASCWTHEPHTHTYAQLSNSRPIKANRTHRARDGESPSLARRKHAACRTCCEISIATRATARARAPGFAFVTGAPRVSAAREARACISSAATHTRVRRKKDDEGNNRATTTTTTTTTTTRDIADSLYWALTGPAAQSHSPSIATTPQIPRPRKSTQALLCFTAAAPRAAAGRPAPAATASRLRLRLRLRPSARAAYSVTFKHPPPGNGGSNSDITIECGPDTLLLDAADAAQLDLPSCCRAGACCVCAVKVVSGQVERQQPQYVDDNAAQKGFALLCSTYPRSDLVVMTHQEQALFAEEVGEYGARR